MPPRITQQSCMTWLEARVSDRTMVGTPTTHCLLAFHNGEAVSRMAKHAPNTTPSAARARRCQPYGSWRKGLNVENRLTPPSWGKNFLLTFPFIEPVHRPEQLCLD